MNEKLTEILNDICWAMSNLNDRICSLERGEDGCGFTQSNWDTINEIMNKVHMLKIEVDS